MSSGDGDSRPLEPVDYVLGDGDEQEREAFRGELDGDLELVTEVAELRDMLQRFRDVGVAPTGRVERGVRRVMARRLRLLRPARLDWQGRLAVVSRVAAVALITLAVAWSVLAVARPAGSRWDGVEVATFGLPALGSPVGASKRLAVGTESPMALTYRNDPELAVLLDDDVLPVAARSFAESAARFSEVAIPGDFQGMLSAENLLSQLRAESSMRFSAAARARARARTGTPDLDDRVQALADVVAGRALAALRSETTDADAVAFALRALVAAGSSGDTGPHRDVVLRCRQYLLRALDDLRAGSRATVVAALCELAVLGDVEVGDRVAVEADRLARETLRAAPPDGPRPALLYWQTPPRQLADAGRVLGIAPAFGTHAGLAFRARLMIAAHVGERLAVGADAEQPELIAAQLYGFGDLIDRREADRRLALWRLGSLLRDFVAMHHVAWSKYPVRPGWAEFQQELRGLAAVPTPDGLRDASALLLTLCTNFAAPGFSEGLGPAAL